MAVTLILRTGTWIPLCESTWGLGPRGQQHRETLPFLLHCARKGVCLITGKLANRRLDLSHSKFVGFPSLWEVDAREFLRKI